MSTIAPPVDQTPAVAVAADVSVKPAKAARASRRSAPALPQAEAAPPAVAVTKTPAKVPRKSVPVPVATSAAARPEQAVAEPVDKAAKAVKVVNVVKVAKAAKPVKTSKVAEKAVKPPRLPKAAAVDIVPHPALPPAPEPRDDIVRDSFTIPEGEYRVIDELKRRALVLQQPIKKSELLRAGLKLLAALPDEALLAALLAVPTLKTGRPAGKPGKARHKKG